VNLTDWERKLMLAADGVDGSASDGPDVIIDEPTDDETDYVVEGSEEAKNIQPTDVKSREEIMAELAKTREELVALQAGAAPVTALQSTMEKMMSNMAPVKAPRKDGSTSMQTFNGNRMSDVDFEKHINQLMLENPYQAQQEMQTRMMEPILQITAVNNAQTSRELLFANPEQKKLYDRYADEIEEHVANIPMIERVKNARVYQSALNAVKAAHMEELSNESTSAQVASLVAAELAKYGIKPGETPVNTNKPAQTAYNAPQSLSARPTASTSTTRKVISIPQNVAHEARQRGLDPGFYYEHLKSKGLIK